MKPKNKTEREVCCYKLPFHLTGAQTEWALSLASPDKARTFRGKNTCIVHFGIVTTHKGWQVIRQYYLYAYYAYKKLKNYWIGEVMQTWLKDGERVHFIRPVQGQSYYLDAWCFGSDLSLKRMSDTEIGDKYSKLNWECDWMKLVKVQKKYRYIPKELKDKFPLQQLFRAINASKYCETLMKKDPVCFKWCVEKGYAFNKEKMEAVKIAQRYKYDYTNHLWADMIDNLFYLRKDLHNPKLVCPVNIQEAHDKWSKMAANRRMRIMNGIIKANMIRQERERLEREERMARMEAERKEREAALVSQYPKMRGKFFGVVIAENDIEIKVLQSVREFFEEGKEMNHCVFANAYYDVIQRPNCLILSAKVKGHRMETIEVNMADWSIVQCRGKHNVDSKYHQQIMELMTKNMNKVKEAV